MSMDPEVLATQPLFREFSLSELRALAALFEEVEVTAGTTLILEDEGPGPLFLVLEGQVAVLRALPGTQDMVLARLTPGRLVGYLAHVDGRSRSASVRAVTAVRAARMTGEQVARLFRANGSLAARFQLVLARDLIRTLRVANRRFTLAATLPPDRFHSITHLEGLLEELEAEADITDGLEPLETR